MRRGLAVGCAVAALLAVAAPGTAADAAVTVAQPAAINPVEIRGTAGTASEDTPSVTVNFYAGTEASGDVQSSQRVGFGDDGAFSVPTTWLADGTWTVQAVQTDAAHHEATSTPRTFRIDRGAPAVALTAPDQFTGEALPQFVGT